MTRTLGRRLRWRTGVLGLALVAAGTSCAQGQGAAPARSPDPGLPSSPPPAAAPGPAAVPSFPEGHPAVAAAPAPGETLAGTVEITPALRARHEAGAILFVVARKAGTREVLAVKREGEVRLPHAFELSGRDGMTGDVSLSGLLDITARLSRSGDAIPAAGDLEGVARGVAVGRRRVKVVIDTTRP